MAALVRLIFLVCLTAGLAIPQSTAQETASDPLRDKAMAGSPLHNWTNKGRSTAPASMLSGGEAAGTAAQDVSAVAGTYAGQIGTTKFYIQFLNEGFHAVMLGEPYPLLGVFGRITVSDDVITLQELVGCDEEQVGRYRFELTEESIKLTILEDPCTDRGEVLGGQTMSRVEANSGGAVEAANPQ